ncbi:MAG: SusD/RagB family nutrient-binding outer membrane lipoprotein [Flavisolibacter sp.]
MKLKNKFLIFTILAGVAFSGCKKDFLDINTNPNLATTATPELVLSTALTGTGVTLNPQSSPNTWFNGWMGYWAISGSYAISSSDFTTYKQTTNTADAFWQNIYHNLNDYNYVKTQAIVQKKPFYEAVSRIMMSYNFQILVDMFGNVPYSDAFQGTVVIHPKYDDQKVIYADLIKQIDTAITLLKRADAKGLASSDVMFGGDNEEWIRFANTLELRILMRQSEVNPSYVQTQIAKIEAEGSGFLQPGEDAEVNPGYSPSNANPFFAANFNISGTYINDFWRANQYSITFFKNNNDPRLTQVYAPSGTGKFQGNSIGQIGGLVGSDASIFGPGVLKSASQGLLIMPASESFFLQAEAALRTWITDDPEALYEQGVTESFRYLSVPDYANEAATYYSQTNNKNTTWASTTSFNEQLALIIRQKWASENTIMPIEAYDDYRRLHLPADIPLSISPYVDVLAIPLRFLYPFSEYQTNPENVNAQGEINHHQSKIFWMP